MVSYKVRNSAMRMEEHAIARARTLYGLTIEASDLERIADNIHAGRTRCVRRISRTRTVHLVTYRGCFARALYDRNLHVIASFLPV